MSKKILIVDDSPSIREVICFTLQNAGYNVLSAEDGIKALEFVNTNNDIDLIITDLYMPKVVQHLNSNKSFLKKYKLNKKHSTISKPHDYVGLYSNDSSVTYRTSKNYYGQIGFMIRVTSAQSWSKKLIMKLKASNKSGKSSFNSIENIITNKKTTNEEYYYELGEIERQLICGEKSNLLRKSNKDKMLVNSEEKRNAIKCIEENKKVYKEAVSKGFKVSQNKVLNKIAEFKKKVKETDNYNDYLSSELWL